MRVCVRHSQCMSKVGFARNIRGELGDASTQIAFDRFIAVHKKIQERITKVWVQLCSHPLWS